MAGTVRHADCSAARGSARAVRTLSENGTMSRRLAGGDCDQLPPAALSGGTTDSNVASTIDALASYARAFDEISEADGRRYSAAAFVEWIRLEIGSNGAFRGERTGRPSESGPLANGAASSMPDELSA